MSSFATKSFVVAAFVCVATVGNPEGRLLMSYAAGRIVARDETTACNYYSPGDKPGNKIGNRPRRLRLRTTRTCPPIRSWESEHRAVSSNRRIQQQ